MNNKTTVVICCAGMGTRLGIGLPKALVKIDGQPLIIHQLELLRNFDDVRIVVGFQADKIIEIVKKFRKDVTFVFNYDYETTGPAASLSKALLHTKEYVLSIGGDVLINPEDFKKIVSADECIPYTDINSNEPTLIKIKDGKVLAIGKDGKYEWQGIVKIKRDNLSENKNYIYEMLIPKLPLDGIYIKSREIDSQDDYDNTVAFYNRGYK